MRPERWQQIEELFQQATALPTAERPSFIERAAGHDPELRQQLESLLSAHDRTDDFLEQPAVPGGISQALRPPEEPAAKDHIGPYKLLRKLGEGGMSHVHLAVRDDDQFQKLVALKIIRRGMDTDDLLSRFRRERQILAGLDHPNIASLHDGGTTGDGLPYYVMDHIEGVPIDEYCDQGRLSVDQRLRLFLEVSEAVQYAHQNLVVHRDLKARNILVTADGTPKLLDFGIAKLLRPEQFPVPVEVTAANLRPMTPYYASPEQIQGKAITTASDVYSLGVLLYRLLTGHFPYRFETWTPREVEQRVLEQEPERPSTAATRVETFPGPGGDKGTISPKDVSRARSMLPKQLKRKLAGDLDNILLMALRKEPQRRYASVGQFADDIRRYLAGEPVLAHRGTLRYRTAKFVRRNWAPASIAAAFVALLVGFSATMAVQNTRIARQRDQAQRERDRAEQVVTFLQDIFQVSDPLEAGGEGTTARGESITAREILDQGAARVAQELSDQPEIQATLKEAIANVYRNLGLFDRAEPLLQEALAARQQAGEENLGVAQSLNNLGALLRDKGEFEAARPLFERSLAIRTRLLGDNHPEVAHGLHHLGLIHYETGDYSRAEELYRRALGAERQAHPEGTAELAAQLSDLAELLVQMGNYDGAEPLYREALNIRRKVFGARHALVAESMNDLGVFLGITGDFDGSEPLLRDALDMRRETLGDRHPSVAQTLNNLGRLFHEMKNFSDAEALYLEALEIERQQLGAEHPLVARRLNNLAVVQHDMGKLEEAEVSFREALAMKRRVFGPNHAQVGFSLNGLGALLIRMNRAQEAEPLLREGVRVLAAALPADHWRTAETRAHLGDCLAAQGRYQDAESLLVTGYETLRETRGPDNHRTRHALSRLVALYEAWGKAEEAERYRALEAPAG